MSTVNIFLRVRHGKRDELLQTLQSMRKNLKAEEDLLKSSLYEDTEDPGVFYLIEDWATQDSMDRYIRSEQFSQLMGALKVLCSESEIKYQLTAGKPGAMIAEL